MRWKPKKYNRIDRKITTRRFFAWIPILLDGEYRWLEFVTVEGFWWLGKASGRWYWESEKFIDNQNK